MARVRVSSLVRLLLLLATLAFAAPVPAPTLSSRALVVSPTESAVFQTVYWPFSVPDGAKNSNDLPPLASVFSDVAWGQTGTHTLSASTPINSAQVHSPELLVPTATSTTVSASTSVDSTPHVSSAGKYKTYAIIVGCLLTAFIIAGTWNLSCRNRERGRKWDHDSALREKNRSGSLDEGDLSMRSEEDENVKRARQSWWTNREVEIDFGAGIVTVADPNLKNTVEDVFVPPAPPPHRKSEVIPNVIQSSRGQLRRSTSSPLLATPSPIRISSESVLDETELIASLNLDRSSGSSTSSFATAEAHPVWYFPPVTMAHSRTKSAPVGRASMTESEWDIAGDYGAPRVDRTT